MQVANSNWLLIGPRKDFLCWAAARLEKIFSITPTVVVARRGWVRQLKHQLKEKPAAVVLLLATEQMKTAPIELAQTCQRRGQLMCAFLPDSTPTLSAWMLKQLLEQEGAVVHHQFDLLVECGRLFQHVHLSGQTEDPTTFGHLMKRGEHGCPSLNVTGRSRKFTGGVTLTEQGVLCWVVNNHALPLYSPPEVVAGAFSALGRFAAVSQPAPAQPQVQFDPSIVDQIARPPARLLSEVTSKRLLAAFGLPMPEETLCHSPSQAVRQASENSTPVTMKLIRPNFRNKSNLGAVLNNLEGPSAVQKGYQQLQAIARQLGPPKPMGVLVTSTVQEASYFWISAIQVAPFGRVILIKQTSSPTDHPLLAISPSASPDTIDSLVSRLPGLNSHQILSMGDLLTKFCFALTTLGTCVDEAHLHPVALPPDGPALILDALVGITNARQGITNAHTNEPSP